MLRRDLNKKQLFYKTGGSVFILNKIKEKTITFTNWVRANQLLFVLILALLVNIGLLIFIDSPWWGVLCFTFLFFLLCLIIFKFLKRFKKKKTKQLSPVLNVLLILFITYLLFPFFMSGMTVIKSYSNKSKLENIASDLVRDTENDYDKTIAVLEWFDEDNKNIYDDYHLLKREVNSFYPYPGTHFELFFDEPYIGIRNFYDSASLWILTSKFGWCNEFGLLFRDIADACGLNVRKVVCSGEDHVWNEVMINGTWICVDATIHHPQISGFNISRQFMERKVGSDIPNVNYGNVSYVYAEWLNGTQVDVTERYTNLINISVAVLDEQNKPVTGIKVELISHNRYNNVNTGYYKITNSSGQCLFTIGGGDYTFRVDNGIFSPIVGENRSSFNENETYHKFEVKVKNDWFKILKFVIILILTILFILYFTGLKKYFKKIKEKLKPIVNYKKNAQKPIRVISEGEIKVLAKWWKRYFYVGFSFVIGGLIVSIIFWDLYITGVLIPLGLAIISIGIGFLSVKIADDSDKKMNINANVNFLKICNDIEDVRVLFNSRIYDRELLTWKTQNLVNMATEMMKEYEEGYIKKEHQDKLVKYVRTTLDCLLQKKPWDKIASNQRGNVLKTWNTIFENKYYYTKKTKKKIREIFIKELRMGKRQNEVNFIKKLQREK